MRKAFIHEGMNAYLDQKDGDGTCIIHADKYEFLVYRLLRNRLEAGHIYVSDSLRFRSFDEDLIPKDTWQRDRQRILEEILRSCRNPWRRNSTAWKRSWRPNPNSCND